MKTRNMNFSFIHIADLHIWSRHKYSVDGSRLKQIKRNLSRVIKFAIKKKVRYVIITGDVFHVNNPDEKELNVFSNFVYKLTTKNIKVRVINGDHDTDGIRCSLDALNKIDKLNKPDMEDKLSIMTGDGIYRELDGKFNMVYIPFNKRIHYLLKVAKKDIDGNANVNLLFTHCGVNLAEASSGYKVKSSITQKMLRGWDYVGLGDFHRYQYLGNNIYYSGSLNRINKGEAEDKKSFNFVYYKDGKLKVKRIMLPDIEFIKVIISYDKLIKFKNKTITEWKGKKVKESFVDVIVKCNKIMDSVDFASSISYIKNAFYNGGAKEVIEKYIMVKKVKGKSRSVMANIDIDLIKGSSNYIKVNADKDKVKRYTNYITKSLNRYI